jgi:hypothetical protein
VVDGTDFGDVAANFNKGSNAPAAVLPVVASPIVLAGSSATVESKTTVTPIAKKFAAVSLPNVGATDTNPVSQKGGNEVLAAVLDQQKKVGQKTQPNNRH